MKTVLHSVSRAFLSFMLLAGLPAFAGYGQAQTPVADWVKAWERAYATGASPVLNNDGFVAAWAQGWQLWSIIMVYEATHENRYLDQFVRAADAVLAARDSVRGVRDYRGLSLPAWQGDPDYTLHQAVVPDQNGHPLLLIRLSEDMRPLRGAVTVNIRTSGNVFTVKARWLYNGMERSEEFKDISLEPAAGKQYIVSAVNGRSRYITAQMLTSLPVAGRSPAAGDYDLVHQGYIFEVHTGHIAYPLARFARLVLLSADAATRDKYGAKAREYAEAVAAAVAVHDADWHENEIGEGWYSADVYAPIWYAGLDVPFNQMHTLGLAMVELYEITGNPAYRDKVEKLAITYKNDLKLNKTAEAYTWGYWWSKGYRFKGWKATDSTPNYMPSMGAQAKDEDISHGGISVAFAYRAWEAGIVFTDTDMQRFANTLKFLVLKEDGTAAPRVSGDGVPVQNVAVMRWLQLAKVYPELLPLAAAACPIGKCNDEFALARLAETTARLAGESK